MYISEYTVAKDLISIGSTHKRRRWRIGDTNDDDTTKKERGGIGRHLRHGNHPERSSCKHLGSSRSTLLSRQENFRKNVSVQKKKKKLAKLRLRVFS